VFEVGLDTLAGAGAAFPGLVEGNSGGEIIWERSFRGRCGEELDERIEFAVSNSVR